MATEQEIHTLLEQRPDTLAFAAAGTPLGAQPTERAPTPPSALRAVAAGAGASAAAARAAPAGCSCQQRLVLSFFFDGTGNNIDADVGTMQHSNVARLYQSHQPDDETLGRYRFYVYGLGTYFKAIGDDGNTARGKGMGHMGQARLDWAFDRFHEKVKAAESRAQNPTNKIIDIKVHVFGFSRGATAARAFVRDLQKLCDFRDGAHRLKQGRHPVELSFLGIFDTVASVGLPMSANNTPGARSAGWYSTTTTVDLRAGNGTENGILGMAFGEPGADPAPGTYDGHASWADGLVVSAPGFVKRCVHMVAGHEIRNSFPLDSALDGTRYPPGVSEIVYPGAHSDVGGGYQPGEGARSEHYGEVLSLVPLRAMHAAAIEAGVPLMDINTLRSRAQIVQRSFALDPEGSRKFAELADHFNHYRTTAGSGGRDVGHEMLAHSLWYLRWRFFNIRRTREAARRGQPGHDQAIVASREPGFAAERRRREADVKARQAEADRAQAQLDRAESDLQAAEYLQARAGRPVPPDLQPRVEQARIEHDRKRDEYLSEKAKLDTFANDSTLAAELTAYDQRLMLDAEAIVAHHRKNPSLKLRPHYANLVSAYLDEFSNGKGLSDAKIIAFFDRYVHDSLAGFAMDSTLPSDPRVVYAGGDNKLRFAGLKSGDRDKRDQQAA
ncbi:phospholipase effector Tle1 domain-containing protein [Aquabacterium sp.]|uniref:phospholipase effector Tle1 domain-containing protein n=1 Tax=Aquabacterium sp. TaxID=1872578 RepID=UPI003785125C